MLARPPRATPQRKPSSPQCEPSHPPRKDAPTETQASAVPDREPLLVGQGGDRGRNQAPRDPQLAAGDAGQHGAEGEVVLVAEQEGQHERRHDGDAEPYGGQQAPWSAPPRAGTVGAAPSPVPGRRNLGSRVR